MPSSARGLLRRVVETAGQPDNITLLRYEPSEGVDTVSQHLVGAVLPVRQAGVHRLRSWPLLDFES